MRHSVYGRKLSRDINERKALLNGLASSLIAQGELTTTLAKAKFAKSYVEKLVSAAKKDRLHKNRILAAKLSGAAFKKLVSEIGPGFKQRKGGYTKITRLVPRRGDASLMAKLEFVEWDKTQAKVPKATKEKKIATTESTEKRLKTLKKKPRGKSDKTVRSVVSRKKVSRKVKKRKIKV